MAKAMQEELFDPTCSDGTPLNEAVSVLIKELRRGKELTALYWAEQIEERFYKYLWRRLLIFCAEDIGVANPDAIVQIEALRAAYMTVREENSRHLVDGNLVTMAVMLLARSPKNREVDNLKNWLSSMIREYQWRPGIPEYALDAHTKRGREHKPTDQEKAVNWFTEGGKVANFAGPIDGYLWHLRHLAHKGWMDREEVEKRAVRWADEGRLMYGLAGIPMPWESECRADDLRTGE